MNLNDFVVLPNNNNPKSLKLNARNLQELRMETVTLAQESKEMEERLQQLRESMSKEKEERGWSGRFRWKSGQTGALSNTSSAKRNKENVLHKLSAGTVKIRVLKDEPLIAPLPPPLPPPSIGHLSSRRPKLKGQICGQCEVRSAGLVCAECGEDYCVGCFAKFHQKGALKLHRMIPIQAEIQTNVNTLDVVRRFQKQISPKSKPAVVPGSPTVVRRGEKGQQTGAILTQHHTQHSQVLVLNHGAEEQYEEEEEMQDEEEKELERVPLLLGGEYDEEESTRSFQEALREWRGGMGEGGDGGDTVLRPAKTQPVSVSAMTQADLPQENGAEAATTGGGGREGGGMVTVKVEFTQHSLSYLDRLLLKKHRRTPIEAHRPLSALASPPRSSAHTHTEEEMATSLTAAEEDFRQYCASLFAVPSKRGGAEPQRATPGSCLHIQILDETVGDSMPGGVFVAEQKTDDNTKFPCPQPVSNTVTRPAQTTEGSPSLNKQSKNLYPSVPQTPLSERSMKSSSSRAKPSPRSTCGLVRTSKTPDKTPTSEPQKPGYSPNLKESNTDHPLRPLSSIPPPRSHPGTPKSISSLPLSASPCLSPLVPVISRSFKPERSSPEEQSTVHPESSYSLRSTFTLSPSSSTHSAESTPLPVVDRSPPSAKGTDSPLLPEQTQSPLLDPESPLSQNNSQSPLLDPESPLSPKNSQSLLLDPESPLSPKNSQSASLVTESHPLPKHSQSPPTPNESPVLRRAPRSKPFTNLPLSSPKESSQLPTSPEPTVNLTSEPVSTPSPASSPTSSKSPPKPLPALSPPSTSSPGRSSRYRSTPSPVSPTSILSPADPPPTSSPSTPPPTEIFSGYVSAPALEAVPFVSPCGGYVSTPSPQETLHLQSDPQQPARARRSPHISVRMDDELSTAMTDSEEETFSDSLHLTPHELDSSDDEGKTDGCLEEWGSREEERSASNPPSEDLSGSVVPEAEQNPDTEELGLMLEPSTALRALAQRAGSGPESFCGLDGFLTLGLDLGSDHTSPRRHRACFPPTHTPPDSQHDSNTQEKNYIGSVNWKPTCILRDCAKEHLVATVMEGSYTQQISTQTCTATPTWKGAMSAYGLETSGSSRPTFSRPVSTDHCSRSRPLSGSFSRPTSGPRASASGPVFHLMSRPLSGPVSRPLSCPASRLLSLAAQEIMEISDVDPTGCEDPDLDADTHTLSCLEQELQLMTKATTDTEMMTLNAVRGNHATKAQHGRHGFARGGVSEDEKEEEEEALRDRQSVLSLP